MARVFSVIHFCDWLWLEKCRIEFNELKRMLSSIIEFGFFFEGYFHRIKLYIICLISPLTHKQKLIYSSPWKFTWKVCQMQRRYWHHLFLLVTGIWFILFCFIVKLPFYYHPFTQSMYFILISSFSWPFSKSQSTLKITVNH